MKRKHKRLTFLAIAAVLVAVATGLVLNAFNDSIVFFRTPTEIADGGMDRGQRLRLGGLVENGSVEKKADGVVLFRVTDTVNSVPVRYKGILPDLFREGQGVVAEGHFDGTRFMADDVLAKHDENYMPPEVADALKKNGQWKGGQE